MPVTLVACCSIVYLVLVHNLMSVMCTCWFAGRSIIAVHLTISCSCIQCNIRMCHCGTIPHWSMTSWFVFIANQTHVLHSGSYVQNSRSKLGCRLASFPEQILFFANNAIFINFTSKSWWILYFFKQCVYVPLWDYLGR